MYNQKVFTLLEHIRLQRTRKIILKRSRGLLLSVQVLELNIWSRISKLWRIVFIFPPNIFLLFVTNQEQKQTNCNANLKFKIIFSPTQAFERTQELLKDSTNLVKLICT